MFQRSRTFLPEVALEPVATWYRQTLAHAERLGNTHIQCVVLHRLGDLADLEAKAKDGIPSIVMSWTNPKCVGYEQVTDSRPWYTKSGRLEFYREENEFIEAGENLPVHREPVDSTFYEPNVIVAPKHEAFRHQ